MYLCRLKNLLTTRLYIHLVIILHVNSILVCTLYPNKPYIYILHIGFTILVYSILYMYTYM